MHAEVEAAIAACIPGLRRHARGLPAERAAVVEFMYGAAGGEPLTRYVTREVAGPDAAWHRDAMRAARPRHTPTLKDFRWTPNDATS